MEAVAQDRRKELRYTRAIDFTDEAAMWYLDNRMSGSELANALKNRDFSEYVRAYVA